MITRSPLMIQYPGYWLPIKLDCLSLIFNIMMINKTGSPFQAWNTKTCNQIKGSDGGYYPPWIHTVTFSVYLSFCLSLSICLSICLFLSFVLRSSLRLCLSSGLSFCLSVFCSLVCLSVFHSFWFFVPLCVFQ
jgi:hypothetical protein